MVVADVPPRPANPDRKNCELEELRLETEALRRDAHYEQSKAYASIFQSVVTAISILVGGGWVFWKFGLAQERYPNIDFTADINPIGVQNGVLIVELIANLENKGKVQHRMSRLEFDLNALMPLEPAVSDSRWGGQINFPTEIARGSFLPPQKEFFFVDPGTKAKYSFIAAVPEDVQFLILHCSFAYTRRGKTGHTAEKTSRIKGQALVVAESSNAASSVQNGST